MTLDVVHVSSSEQDLVSVYRAITKDMIEEDEPGGITGVAVRTMTNTVEVDIDPGDIDRLAPQVLEKYPDVELVIREKGPDANTACTRYACHNSPWKAGINIDRPASGQGPCSTGFVVYKLTYVGGDPVPTYRMITTGHCGYTGSSGSGVGKTWWHDDGSSPFDDYEIGDITVSSYYDGSPCDCQIMSIASGWDGHKYLKGDDNVEDIAGVRLRGDTLNGDPICLSGPKSSSRRCGEITSRWYSSDRPYGITLSNQMLADYNEISGDSGAPVMARYTEDIIGIQSGTREPDDPEAVMSHNAAFLNEFDPYHFCRTGDSWSGC